VEVEVGGRLWAIPVDQVREVLRTPQLVAVPGAPPIVRGIAAVRGGVVTVLDLATGLGVARGDSPGSVVLVGYGERLVGLAVDAVRAVRPMDPAVVGTAAAPTPLDAVALCAGHLLSSEET
jgi:purine-binding chemotaxis protein CheW